MAGVVTDPADHGVLSGPAGHQAIITVVGGTGLDRKIPTVKAVELISPVRQRGTGGGATAAGQIAGIWIRGHIIHDVGGVCLDDLLANRLLPLIDSLVSRVSNLKDVSVRDGLAEPTERG